MQSGGKTICKSIRYESQCKTFKLSRIKRLNYTRKMRQGEEKFRYTVSLGDILAIYVVWDVVSVFDIFLGACGMF